MRARERGSTVSYIVVGVVLAALLVGGIYYVKNRSGDELAVKDTANESSDTAKDSASDTSSDTTTDENDSAATDNSTDTTTNTEDSTSKEDTTTNSGESSTLPKTGVTVDELPRTGANPAFAVIPLSILAATFVAYRRSERAKA